MRLAQLTILTALAFAGCLLQPFVGPAVGEVDVAEGPAEVPSPQYLPTRVLLIKNVRQDATTQGVAKWKADDADGVTVDKLGRVDLNITVVEPALTVEFTTPLALHATMKLVKLNVLEGTISAAGGGRTYRIHLERRE